MSEEIRAVLQRTPLVIRPSKTKVDLDAETTDADLLPPPLQPIIMSAASPACSQIREIVSVNFTTESKVLQESVEEQTDQQEVVKGGDVIVERDRLVESEAGSSSVAEAALADGSNVVVESGIENIPDVAELSNENVPFTTAADENVSQRAAAELTYVINVESATEKLVKEDLVNDNITNVESANESITRGTL